MTTVACPACGRPAEFSPANVSRPFCSSHCKMIDLGAWASEQYRIEAQDEPLSDEAADLPDPPGTTRPTRPQRP